MYPNRTVQEVETDKLQKFIISRIPVRYKLVLVLWTYLIKVPSNTYTLVLTFNLIIVKELWEMRKLWYKFNIWRCDRKMKSICKMCIAFSPMLCDGLNGSYDDVCPEFKLLVEKSKYYRSCLKILIDYEARHRK